MYGVKFGEKHSYRDWGLIMSSRPVISPPESKTVYIDIPASDGSLDLTESLTGDVKFKNRKISFEFTVVDGRNRWTNIYSKILDYLHGQDMKIFLDEDPEYYYFGRVQVNEWQSSKVTSTIKIEANVEPYKLEEFGSLDDWEWNPFNFETGIIRNYKGIEVAESLTLIIEGTRKPIIPVFTTYLASNYNTMNMWFRNSKMSVFEAYTLANGKNRFIDLQVIEGNNEFVFGGYGTVDIDYHGGRL